MTDPIWIAGVGMTTFGIHQSRSAADLAAEAVTAALADADTAITDIDGAFYGSTAQGALDGQLMVAGQVALRRVGFERIPIFNVENACATGATALHLAVNYIRSGAANIVIAVGVDKLSNPDRAKSMAIFDGAYDVSDPDALDRALIELGGTAADTGSGGRSIFMDIYAAMARAHMGKFGTTQQQLAVIAAKNHRNAVHNNKAHYRTVMSVEQILAARALSYPLTVPMCSPITDGAAAAIVYGPSVRVSRVTTRDVRVLASVIGTGAPHPATDYDQHIGRLLAQRAYEHAGITPADISVAEVHDATAFGELIQTEMLGLCPIGTGGSFAESGATSLGGRVPVNPSGGLESKGHPIGATGLAQIFELVNQLRGEATDRQVASARIAVAENGGGFYDTEEAVATITILGRS
jgi:acetyl-CoA acyltransferase